MQMKTQITFSIFVALLLPSCSPMGASGGSPSQFEVDVQSAPQGLIDEKTSKRSEILHSYLAGQFSYIHDDFGTALKYFEEASKLIDDPSPQVHAVLAELYLKERKLQEARREAQRAIQGEPDNASYRLLLAGIHESLGENKEAESQYRTLIKKNKEVPEPYLLLASLLGRTQRLGEAISVLEELVKIHGENAVALELLGRFYELNGDFKNAEKLYKNFQKQYGLTEDIFTSLLRVQLKQNNPKAARELCREKLKEDPRHALATRVLGELAISEGSVQEGIELLRGAEELVRGDDAGNQGSEELRFRIALLELERQNYKAAERELLLIIAQNEKHSEARYYLASIYAGSDRREEALKLLSEIDSESEMFVKARTFAAFLLRQDGKLEEASKSLREVLEKDPKNLKARSYLALILRDAKELEETRDLIKTGLEYFPEDERLLFQYAVVLDDLGEKGESLETMERVIVVNPRNSDALNFIAYSLTEKSGDLNRAEDLVRQALQIRPQDGYYLDTLGWVLFHQGKLEQAEEVLARAVSLADEDIVVLEHYGDVLAKLGKTRLAVNTYKQALESTPEEPSDEEKEALRRIESKLESLAK